MQFLYSIRAFRCSETKKNFLFRKYGNFTTGHLKGDLYCFIAIQVNRELLTRCDDFTEFTSSFHILGFGLKLHFSEAINHRHDCGGTIVTKEFILTAAHLYNKACTNRFKRENNVSQAMQLLHME